MGRDEDEVCGANVFDPVEQQLPQVVDAVADAALALERHLFDLAALATAVRVSPPPDRVGAEAGEAQRRARGLADHRAQVRGGEEAVDADGDGLANLGRLLDAEDVVRRRLGGAQEEALDLLDDGRILLHLIRAREGWE